MVLAFAIGLSPLAAVAFGLTPALRTTAIDPLAALRPGLTGGPSRTTLRRLLVSTQVAFSVVLVAMAGLFGLSLGKLRSVDLGFRDQSIVQFSPNFPSTWKPAQEIAGRDRLLPELEQSPAVAGVSYGVPDLFHGRSWRCDVRVPGSPQPGLPGRA